MNSAALHSDFVTRDMGLGFKASYQRREDGWHQVLFFRYGRRVRELTFRPHQEDDALRAFTTTKPDEMLRAL
jgi:hypothetical protein